MTGGMSHKNIPDRFVFEVPGVRFDEIRVNPENVDLITDVDVYDCHIVDGRNPVSQSIAWVT